MPVDPDEHPSWKSTLWFLFAILIWPLWILVRTARWLRFWRVYRLARHWTFTTSDDGIEVRKKGGPGQIVSWHELAQALWINYVDPGADEESLAIFISSKRAALNEKSGHLYELSRGLTQRGLEPHITDGGRGPSALGDLPLALGWMIAMIAGALAFIVWRLTGG